MELDHVGIVVADIAPFAELFRKMGLSDMSAPQPDPIQKVLACFVTVCKEPPIHVELLEPTEETSPVTNFLRNRGGGLHHICFNVEDLEKTTREFVRNGLKLVVPPVDCSGYDRVFASDGVKGTRIAFFLSSGRLLIELLQKEKSRQVHTESSSRK